jgi:hypothetical protein
LGSEGLGECVSLTRGVIHPSFPLRGRWERIAKSGEQAPSPSLASLLNPSCETHSCTPLMHGLRQWQPRFKFLPSLSLTNTWLYWAIARTAPNPTLQSTLELSKTDSGTRRFFSIPALPVPPSSRTPVTKFSVCPRYRFCVATPAELPHAHFSWYPACLANSWTWRRALTRVFSWVCAHSVGGHTGGVADRDGWHVLLPMRRVKRAPQLREDV